MSGKATKTPFLAAYFLSREFSFHDLYGRSQLYKKAVQTADPQKLSKRIGICGLLQQIKVYLL